ncbi:hypothetical protein DYB25_003748 [Aphanomyces astaci]|uniref:Uncharacterized protein n=1 Tax=Aphanomyces astaci TaxID=112090 RepID=A0A397BQ64_APHAT|nr:hypothetical protein DYB25_003748 [Aphanomyces astaci]RHY88741.1 hypothetical protein DYB26_002582 [Aphanomyces astaci]
MLEVLCAVLAFLLILALTFTNGYWVSSATSMSMVMTWLDLADHTGRVGTGSSEPCGCVQALEQISWYGGADAVRMVDPDTYLRNENHLDPTDILRFKNLKATRHEAIAKILFYGLQIIYAMFWMVSAIVTSSKRKTTG